MDDSGVRPHEILELQIKHIKSDKNGYTLLVREDSKTGAREVRILESVPSLADWLNVHPSGDNPESRCLSIQETGTMASHTNILQLTRCSRGYAKRQGLENCICICLDILRLPEEPQS